MSPLKQASIQALPLRSRSQNQNHLFESQRQNETSPSRIQDLTPLMSDGPNINVVSKWHIKNYQPQVYDEIEKIMQERRKKILKALRKAKRRQKSPKIR